MNTTLVLSDYSEMCALQEKMSMLKDVSIIRSDERLPKGVNKLWLDLTFDLFNRRITPQSLYLCFSSMIDALEHFDAVGGQVVLLRNYPFRSNLPTFITVSKILEQFTQILTETYQAKSLFLPTIISRNSLHSVQSPPVRIIDALRLGSPETIRVKEASRFVLIYEMDVLDILGRDMLLKKDLVVEGVELTLEELYTRSQPIAGDSPVNFDSRHFIQYEYPMLSSDSLNSVNYDLEDMLIDITSYLF